MASPAPNSTAAASVCLWHDGLVLLVLRPEGVWAFPGGKCEMHETTAQAAMRELLEETGIAAEAGEILGEYAIQSVGGRFELTCHRGVYIRGTAAAASDAVQVAWLRFEAAMALPLAPHVADVIRATRPLQGL
jgi:8-oxo-dGTP pyrophosphatase MutT (NUDIX family)